MSQKVLQISAEDAKYLDPNQIASITLVDGTHILVKDAVEAQEFVEEAQNNEEQYQAQTTEEKQPQLRGLGTNLALGAAAAGAAVLGAAALGSALKPRPMMGRPMMGPMVGRPIGGPMMGPGMGRPMGGQMMGPGMGRPMGGPMRGPMGRRF